MVNSASSFCVPFSFVLRTSRNPKSPFRKLNTATSASAPTLKFPRSVLLITFAGFQVERKNNILQTHAHVEKLRHYIAHIFHAAIHTFRMEIGADHIRLKALLHRGYSLSPGECTTTMAYIENDPSLLRRKYKWFHFAAVINNCFSNCWTV